LTLVVRSFDPQKPVPNIIYNVFGGTLNLAPSKRHLVHFGLEKMLLLKTMASAFASAQKTNKRFDGENCKT